MPHVSNLEITVSGRWQSMESYVGDVTMSTIWPGGSDELSWVPSRQTASRFRGGELVVGYIGGAPVWAGSLIEPDPSQDQMTAQGAWREGDNYIALTGAGAATAIPDTAIDAAIARGLAWTRPATIFSTAVAVDAAQIPIRLGDLMDLFTTWGGPIGWGVNPNREVYAAAADTGPTYQILPIAGGLGYALDDFVSQLFGRYINLSATPSTANSIDTTADTLHGHREDVVDLTGRGPISATNAASILTQILANGRSTPQWTIPIEVSYGEILTLGGVPVPLEIVAAGHLVRIHGGFELAQRLNGAMYIDVPIGRTELSAGLLTVTPAQIAARTLTDALALVAAGGK